MVITARLAVSASVNAGSPRPSETLVTLVEAQPAPNMQSKETKQRTVLLIDGDVLVYQAGLSVEKITNWGDGLWTLHSDETEGRASLDRKIESLREALGGDEVRLVLSCSTDEGFRRRLCPTYKANRKDQRKPIIHGPLREYAIAHHAAITRPGLEADDILGIMATEPTTERRIIVSVDKDFKGVPCLFYRTCEDSPEVRQITREEATRFHAIQTLMGDAVDGYQGIPGVGPKTAEKLLAGVPVDALWTTIKAAYDKAGLSEEVALTNARLARILQHGDYDKKTGKIKLWTPQKSPSPKTSQASSS
jgi:DNA polymerase I